MSGLEEIVSSLAVSGPLSGVLGYAVLTLWRHLQAKEGELIAARTETAEVRRQAAEQVAEVRKECADKVAAIHVTCEAKIEALHRQNVDVLREFAIGLRGGDSG